MRGSLCYWVKVCLCPISTSSQSPKGRNQHKKISNLLILNPPPFFWRYLKSFLDRIIIAIVSVFCLQPSPSSLVDVFGELPPVPGLRPFLSSTWSLPPEIFIITFSIFINKRLNERRIGDKASEGKCLTKSATAFI